MEKIEVMVNHIMSEVDPKIFGHFTEHAFRNIYEGMGISIMPTIGQPSPDTTISAGKENRAINRCLLFSASAMCA